MDQDWTPVTMTKTLKQKTAGLSSAQGIAVARREGLVQTVAKSSVLGGGSQLRKLEESTEEFKHQTVDKELSKAINQARLAKKMTQKDLATAINERPQIIQEYEAGKAIPSPQILSKLDKALGIHLPRKKK